jgi:hypothetical protein
MRTTTDDMMLTPSQGCCALYELHGFDDELQSGHKVDEFLDLYDSHYAGRGQLCFVFFTDTLAKSSGRRLAAYIEKNQLGAIISTIPKTNPKSHRKVMCWIWDIDWKALRSWQENR